MYVCICNAVNEKAIHQAVSDGAKSVRDVRRCLNVGSQCGQCVRHAHEVVEQAKSQIELQTTEFYAA
ncbi:MAG: (2Fe-2S)-binding protein [Oleispira sp.]|nr:(2Fe-2S)-binding protein [Oleispira sp.]